VALRLLRLLFLSSLTILIAACANETTESIILSNLVESGPSAADVQDAFPGPAYADRVAGLVMLVCTILENRRLACVVDHEAPAGYGFGDAALRLSRLIVTKPLSSDSRLLVGSRIAVPIRFALPE
jgi:hypothetical protein